MMKFYVFAVCLSVVVVAALGNPGLRSVEIKHPLLERFGGQRVPGVRITGGQEVVPNSIPQQVALLITTPQGTGFCGGSLISQTVVLTAAHCAELSSNIQVVLGAHNINIQEPTQVRLSVSRILIHDGWSASTLQNDIALLFLSTAVQLTPEIQLARLPSASGLDNTWVDDIATASGWGLPSDTATSISDTLRSVDVRVRSNLACNLYYLGILQGTHICTAGDEGRSTCSGDSGGPLVSSTGVQIGIVSFGISLGCEIGWPAVYTRVTSFVGWIANNTNDVVITP